MKQSTAFITFIKTFAITSLYDLCSVLDVSGSAFYRGELSITDDICYRFYSFDDNSSIAIRITKNDSFTIGNYPSSNAIKSIKKEFPNSTWNEFIEDF